MATTSTTWTIDPVHSNVECSLDYNGLRRRTGTGFARWRARSSSTDPARGRVGHRVDPGAERRRDQ